MSKKFTNVDSYDASVDQVWAMLSDRAYTEGKYAALAAENFEWITFNASEDALTLSSVRSVEANVPAAVKKVIGEKAVVTQTEKWTRSGDALSGTVEVLTKGAPGGITGTMSVKPQGAGVVWDLDFEIKVPIPLLGGKFEQTALDETTANTAAEKVYNAEYLAK